MSRVYKVIFEDDLEYVLDIYEVAKEIISVVDFLKTVEKGEDYIDLRLRCFEGQVNLSFGDIQYEVDHRGEWSYGGASLYEDKEYYYLQAKELVDQLVKQSVVVTKE
jgi:hypothetical protein